MNTLEIVDTIRRAPSVRGVRRLVREAMKLGPGKTWNQKGVQKEARHRIATLQKGRGTEDPIAEIRRSGFEFGPVDWSQGNQI